MSLTEKHIQVSKLLHEGLPTSRIAETIGVSIATIDRWKTKPEIKELTQRFSRDSIEIARRSSHERQNELYAQLERVRQKAIDKLEELLDDPESAGRNEIALIRIAGKWAGLEAIGDRPHHPTRTLRRHNPKDRRSHVTKIPANQGVG